MRELWACSDGTCVKCSRMRKPWRMTLLAWFSAGRTCELLAKKTLQNSALCNGLHFYIFSGHLEPWAKLAKLHFLGGRNFLELWKISKFHHFKRLISDHRNRIPRMSAIKLCLRIDSLKNADFWGPFAKVEHGLMNSWKIFLSQLYLLQLSHVCLWSFLWKKSVFFARNK